ncbi:hypothetical protein Slala02_15410 [Streptomyces lavendulae subsp. lavendulae]|nr:hypothetical protein Slala01_46390 [Streptomyces lavendulae subsp. lavendulae]GLX25721.1 hypothetical protein Slala02_15410 [Streptomyces lavendulae subsp. lavendulae]
MRLRRADDMTSVTRQLAFIAPPPNETVPYSSETTSPTNETKPFRFASGVAWVTRRG